MELSNLKKLILLGAAAGVVTSPVGAEQGSVSESTYYVASCGGEDRCGYKGPKTGSQGQNQGQYYQGNNGNNGNFERVSPQANAPQTYNQTNPAPVAKPNSNDQSGQQGSNGMKSTDQNSKTGTQTSRLNQNRDRQLTDAYQDQPSNVRPDTNTKSDQKPGSQTSRYYQKRDRELSDNSADMPSNGIPPSMKPSNGIIQNNSQQSGAMKPGSSMNNGMNSNGTSSPSTGYPSTR